MASRLRSTVKRTASSWHRPAPAARVSATWASTESSSSSTAAIPPWANQVAPSLMVFLLRTATLAWLAKWWARVSPAAPDPMIKTSLLWYLRIFSPVVGLWPLVYWGPVGAPVYTRMPSCRTGMRLCLHLTRYAGGLRVLSGYNGPLKFLYYSRFVRAWALGQNAQPEWDMKYLGGRRGRRSTFNSDACLWASISLSECLGVFE